ncbi:hypothetical protein BH11MYX3_BH11MYX3_42710 [soil metagenome]
MRGAWLLLAGSACSFTMTPAPSPVPASGPVACTSADTRPALDALAAVTAAGVAFYFHAYAGPDHTSGAESFEYRTWGTVLVGTGLLAGAIYGHRVSGRCATARAELAARRRETERLARLREVTRATSWDLTKQAEAAALAGNCAIVAKLDARVKADDRAFYEAVFARSIAIKKCAP